MKKLSTIFNLLIFCSIASFGQPKSNETKIEALLKQMTIEEKAGQMTQLSLDMVCDGNPYALVEPLHINADKLKNVIQKLNVGSILNLGTTAHLPQRWQEIVSTIQDEATKSRLKIPVLYGIDAIHGANYTAKSTLYPQPVGIAATWNPSLAKQLAELTAYECRASGIPWVFSPAMDLCRNPTWPRNWESFGEDILMNTVFGAAMVEGYQGNNMADKFHVASCMKHFTGYGASISGKDRTTAWIPDRQLRELYLPQYAEAVKKGAMTVMINSGNINNVPGHINHELITDILKGEMGFKGFAISDWEDVKYLYTRHHVAKDYKDAIKMAILAGVDMTMVPVDLEFTPLLIQLIKEKQIPMARIDDAVRRILRVKFQLGLFEKTVYPLSDYPDFGGEKFRTQALNAARESIILLQNKNNTLPLSAQKPLLVVGSTANNMRSLNGGWTYTWQGEQTDKFLADKNTILESLQQKLGASNISYFEGFNDDGITNLSDAITALKSGKFDNVVVCMGEFNYTEFMGSISDLHIGAPTSQAMAQLQKTADSLGKKVTIVLTEGRPRLITDFSDKAQAIVLALYPGAEAGQAITDILFGTVNPSGKLPFTYPKYANSIIPYNHTQLEEGFDGFASGKNKYFDPLFPFGFGLSYTNFTYSNFKINKQQFTKKDTITFSVDVTNSGNAVGKEVVQLFISDLVASLNPAVKNLKGFDKISLNVGQTKTVVIKVPVYQLAFVGIDNKWVVEAGEFSAAIADKTIKFEVK